MRISMKLATELAQEIGSTDWSIVRDQVDIATSGELDCWQLDMLTGWAVEVARNREG
tara:strand:- start:45 stop:215 length:171 start_codon:yes stop_codon:yes gene_type:complete